MTSPKVAARDAAIIAAAEQLKADTGKRPTHRQLAEHVGCSAARVSAAYKRKREAEGDAKKGTGGRKPAPLLDTVVALCKGAIDVARDFKGLPRSSFTAWATRLRGHQDWEKKLRRLCAPPAPPEPEQLELELELDPVQRVKQALAAIKRDLDNAETETERRQHRKSEHEWMSLLIRLEPPEQEKDKADSAEWARSGLEKLKALARRLGEEQTEERQQQHKQLLAEGLLDKPDARRALRIVRWLPKEEEDNGRER